MAKVEFDNVSFSYPVFNVSSRSLKVAFMERISSGKNGEPGLVKVNALRDVSFSVRDGDKLGLIGRNGSGKSTILRLAAGLAHPSNGKITTEGRVVSLIEIGLGINPELSGADNIELPLRLLGATNDEVQQARRDIPEFTGLGDFIHLPVRTYSAGMRTRLAFALCTALSAEILVMDEWLGTGDAEFVQKAQERLRNLVDKSEILVLASHSPDLVRAVCNKALWLEGGKLMMAGEANEVVDAYLADVADAHNRNAARLAAE